MDVKKRGRGDVTPIVPVGAVRGGTTALVVRGADGEPPDLLGSPPGAADPEAEQAAPRLRAAV